MRRSGNRVLVDSERWAEHPANEINRIALCRRHDEAVAAGCNLGEIGRCGADRSFILQQDDGAAIAPGDPPDAKHVLAESIGFAIRRHRRDLRCGHVEPQHTVAPFDLENPASRPKTDDAVTQHDLRACQGRMTAQVDFDRRGKPA